MQHFLHRLVLISAQADELDVNSKKNFYQFSVSMVQIDGRQSYMS